MIELEAPLQTVYQPLLNNFIFRFQQDNAYYVEVTINGVYTLVFYPINGVYWFDLSESLSSAMIDTLNPFNGHLVNIVMKFYNSFNSNVETRNYQYTMLPFGYDIQDDFSYTPLTQDFIASPLEVYRFEGYPLEVLKYESDGAVSDAINDVTVVNKSLKCGVFLSWFNRKGGRSSWLFHKGDLRGNFADRGDLNNNFKNPLQTYRPTINMGKDAVNTLSVWSGLLIGKEVDYVSDIFYSPAVYLKTQTKEISIKVKNSNELLNRKNSLSNEFILSLEMPKNNNLTF